MAVEGVDKEGRSHGDQASLIGMNERQCLQEGTSGAKQAAEKRRTASEDRTLSG